MVDGKGKPNEDVRPGRESHEEFLELCAVSTSGSLSEEEQKKLRAHLAVCSECREAMKQFEGVVDRTIPALATELAKETPEEDSAFSPEAAEASFRERLSEENKRSQSHLRDVEPWLSPLVVRQSRNFRRSFEKYYFWLPLTAVLLLCTSLGILAYRIGKHRGVEVGRLEQGSAPIAPASSPQALEIASRDRDAANAQLVERNKAIAALKREIEQESSENAKLKALQLEQELALQTGDKEKKQLAEERDRIAQQAAAGQEALQASLAKLEGLEKERSADVIRAASFEARVQELSRALKEQQRTTSEQEELLAKDKDIRELMGARELHIIEVHDVARTGETEKVFGRVFYTEGKSLIFYAYDLNDRPGLKDASTFQAWGRRGPDWTQAFKLGMFYEDNVSKKRWVVKSNDKKTLDQIDAVFVTVEPHGGSERPTGKPLLFAYLKVAPNHP
jgi:ribosomal protein S13